MGVWAGHGAYNGYEAPKASVRHQSGYLEIVDFDRQGKSGGSVRYLEEYDLRSFGWIYYTGTKAECEKALLLLLALGESDDLPYELELNERTVANVAEQVAALLKGKD